MSSSRFPDLRAFEFRGSFSSYLVRRGGWWKGGLERSWATEVLRRHIQADVFLGQRVASWFRFESNGLGLYDDQRVLELLLQAVASGSVVVCERVLPRPNYSFPSRAHLPEVSPSPTPAPLEPIVEDLRSLRIVQCPAQFDPRCEPLRINYLLRDFSARPVELVIRSQARPEPPVHRRPLLPDQTADGPGQLEWDGRNESTGEFVERSLAPFLVELVHDATYRDEAPTTLPPAAQVHVVEMEDLLFATGRAILMPDGGFDEKAEDKQQRATGLHAIAAVLRHAAFHRGQKIGVFGHTDTIGSDASNLQLSADRALNVVHVLTGDAEAWAAHCDQHCQVADFQRVLKWIAQNKGWPTDPGAIDNEFGSASRSARTSFRALMNEHYETTLAQGVKQNVEDWKAYLTLFDEELCRILGSSQADLDRIRDRLEFAEPASVGCGEAFPADQPGVNNLQSATNRRVDLVFFEPHELPELPGDPPGAPLYGTEDYEARYLPIGKGGGKLPVLLRLLDGDRPLAGTPYLIERGDELLDSGTSKGDGTLFADLPRELPDLILRLPAVGRSYLLEVATLPPLSEMAGAQGRLSNLGYPCPISGELDSETREALLAFQHDRQLSASGELDDDTQIALRLVHDL